MGGDASRGRCPHKAAAGARARACVFRRSHAAASRAPRPFNLRERACLRAAAVYLGAMLNEGQYDLTTGAGLVACPRCDALHVELELPSGETARCVRCHTVLARPREGAFVQIVALSFTQVVLMIAALFFPFLEISKMGFGNDTSLFGVALAFSTGWLMPLTAAVVIFIVALPMMRAILLIYTLLPMAQGRAPARHAAQAFRASEIMRPWSMAEIFVIGTAIALVKVGGIATIHMGPAFWAFCGLILVGAASRAYTCSTSIWDALEDMGAPTDGREMQPAGAPVTTGATVTTGAQGVLKAQASG